LTLPDQAGIGLKMGQAVAAAVLDLVRRDEATLRLEGPLLPRTGGTRWTNRDQRTGYHNFGRWPGMRSCDVVTWSLAVPENFSGVSGRSANTGEGVEKVGATRRVAPTGLPGTRPPGIPRAFRGGFVCGFSTRARGDLTERTNAGKIEDCMRSARLESVGPPARQLSIEEVSDEVGE
jgi:hypothetical protein